MKVVVFVKKAIGHGSNGRIVEILSFRERFAKKDFDDTIPIVMEMNIPCNDYESNCFNCARCEYNDWETCDRIKYLRLEWSAGTIDLPPKPINKSRYKINWTPYLSSDSIELMDKKDKVVSERDLISSRADKNQRSITDIEDTKVNALER